MFVCGFNSFDQLSELVLSEEQNRSCSVRKFARAVRETPKKIKSIAFAWNYSVITDGNGGFWRSGFINNESSKFSVIHNMPFNSVDIKQVVCAREKFFCLTIDGQIWEQNLTTNEWRDLKMLLPFRNLVGDDVKITKVCMGSTLVAALTEDGKAFLLPYEELHVPSELGHVVDLDCGHEHGVLLTSEGHVLTWGIALRGQLGNDSVDMSSQPEVIDALAGLKFVAIAAGGWHTCAVSVDGDLYAWGWNKYGQLGHPRPQDNLGTGVSVAYLPLVIDWPLTTSAQVVNVRCGTNHTIAVLSNGEPWGCGWNKYGQLGLGDTEVVSSMTKLNFPGGSVVTEVICGPWNSALLTETDGIQDTSPT